MFALTFLGHQGWIIRSAHTCLLVDPLLCEGFGEVYALEYRVHPPRVFGPEAFPAVDALILSHEHDDHFDIPSLARLDRRIPVYLSAHSSSAAFQILREMGFVVHPLVPGVPIEIGDLEVSPFCGDHLSVNCDDEWDTLPFLIRDKNGAGSFFSMVDIMMLPGHVEWAKACAPHPGLVSWTNNTLDWSHMADNQFALEAGTEECVRKMGAGRELILARWGTPGATLMCGGGFSFHGERAWLNQRVFGIDTVAVCNTLARLHKGERFFPTLPGQTFWMERNRLVKVDESTPFLGVVPQSQWPARGRSAVPVPDYPPATGRRDLGDGDDERLQQALRKLAGALVGGILFRSLHSILTGAVVGRKPTFALVLRHGSQGASRVFEYDASGCAFVPGDAGDPRGSYLAGLECWASDFLAVLSGELGPITLAYGRARHWNALEQAFRFDLFESLYRLSHPLSRPAEYLKTYRRLWEKSSMAVPMIRAKSGERTSTDALPLHTG